MPKSPDPMLIMERNRLLEEIESLNERLRNSDGEIRSRGEKLSEITSELEDLRKIYHSTKTELEYAKSQIDNLENQLENTIKEKEILSANLNNLTNSFKTISESTQNYTDVKSKIADLNEKITKLEVKNRELNEKIFSITREKDGLMKEKLEFMEAAMNEKMNLRSSNTKLELQLELQKNQIKDLRQKKRDSEEGLLGSAMQIEQLKKEVDTKAKQIEVMRADEGVISEESGVLSDIPSLVEYTINGLKNVSRSLRLVCPSIEFLIENRIIDILKQNTKKIIINLAVPIDEKLNHGIIDDLKQMGASVINTTERNKYAMNIDGAKIALGIVSGVKARALFTDIPELVGILTEVIMTAFVKGVKV